MSASDFGGDMVTSGLGLAPGNPPPFPENRPQVASSPPPAVATPVPEPAPLTPPLPSTPPAPLPSYEGTHLDTTA